MPATEEAEWVNFLPPWWDIRVTECLAPGRASARFPLPVRVSAGLYLVLDPEFRIVGVSDGYLAASRCSPG